MLQRRLEFHITTSLQASAYIQALQLAPGIPESTSGSLKRQLRAVVASIVGLNTALEIGLKVFAPELTGFANAFKDTLSDSSIQVGSC